MNDHENRNYKRPQLWRVEITIWVKRVGTPPPNAPAMQQKSLIVGAVALNMESALKAVRERYPECRFDKVDKGDPVEIVVEDHPAASEVLEALQR